MVANTCCGLASEYKLYKVYSNVSLNNKWRNFWMNCQCLKTLGIWDRNEREFPFPVKGGKKSPISLPFLREREKRIYFFPISFHTLFTSVNSSHFPHAKKMQILKKLTCWTFCWKNFGNFRTLSQFSPYFSFPLKKKLIISFPFPHHAKNIQYFLHVSFPHWK